MKRLLYLVLGVVTFLGSLESLLAQGTAFTYQGKLTGSNGVAASGLYDFQFKLHPGPIDTNLVGSAFPAPAVQVSNGLFTAQVDFGAGIFAGAPLWLEIGVRTNGGASYTSLSPTQPLTPTPYAITAQQITGSVNDSQLSANIVRLTTGGTFTMPVNLASGSTGSNGTFSGTLSGTFSGAASGTFNGTGTFSGTHIGDGHSISNLNVTNILGVVQANPNWQLVQSSPQQAASANNYLVTAAAQTTVILPASPGVGDTFRLSGAGVGGWIISQSGSQSILTGPLGLPAGKNWATNGAPSKPYVSVASSIDGTKLVAAGLNDQLFTSADAGASWVPRDSSRAWQSVASSADGVHLVAVVNGTTPYTSVDSGAHWTAHGPSGNAYYAVASSADGSKLVSVALNGLIYTSVDYGTTWVSRATSQPWHGVASSTDGTKLAACINGGTFYTSTDSGVTWIAHGSTGNYYSIASSADGTKLAAVANNGFIYTSGDSGNNWIQRGTSQPWISISSSYDGNTLIAAVNNGPVYASFDSGQTWTARISGSLAWYAVSISGDSTRAVAAINNGGMNSSFSATTAGAAGSLIGTQYSNIELQHVGSGVWQPLQFLGHFTGN